jgi:hypothetical protein
MVTGREQPSVRHFADRRAATYGARGCVLRCLLRLRRYAVAAQRVDTALFLIVPAVWNVTHG